MTEKRSVLTSFNGSLKCLNWSVFRQEDDFRNRYFTTGERGFRLQSQNEDTQCKHPQVCNTVDNRRISARKVQMCEQINRSTNEPEMKDS